MSNQSGIDGAYTINTFDETSSKRSNADYMISPDINKFILKEDERKIMVEDVDTNSQELVRGNEALAEFMKLKNKVE